MGFSVMIYALSIIEKNAMACITGLTYTILWFFAHLWYLWFTIL